MHHSVLEDTHSHAAKLLPDLDDVCKVSSCGHGRINSVSRSEMPLSAGKCPDWFILNQDMQSDPLCTSPTGKTYDGIGCFPLGVDVSLDDFEEIVSSQRNLKKLDLLDPIPSHVLSGFGHTLNEFIGSSKTASSETLNSRGAILELANTLLDSGDEVSRGINVFLGLHSGFQRSPEKQFWAVHHLRSSSVIDVYMSKDVQDLIGAVLHTFLSSKGFTRHQCFSTEVAFDRWRDHLAESQATRRILQDVARLSPHECILLLQRISLTSFPGTDEVFEIVRSALNDKLISEPTIAQLKALSAFDYVGGAITLDELVENRLGWHCKSNSAHMETSSAVALFRSIEAKILLSLKLHDSETVQQVTEILGALLTRSNIDAASDIIALAVFCTMRKLAFEEIYLEVSDRNPLFNDQSDQYAAFAELFALGSRCESYFDISPSRFGELLSAKFRYHYLKTGNQPSMGDESTALRSAYTEAEIDVDPKHRDSEMPAYQRFTFLSVFAIPALIDILMLTTTGHGLYLSSKMSYQEQHSATVALMIALLVSGAIGTWITCGGTYYMASMAFSAMNYFVITRLLGGFVLTLIVATVGLIAFTCSSNISAGIVFFLYFIALTTYLCLLAALANYQFTGSAFNSVSKPLSYSFSSVKTNSYF